VPVTVFGRGVQPGQLVHADKHGFLAIPPEDEERLLAAAAFMDANECRTVIEAARGASGMSADAVLAGINAAAKRFREAAEREFHRSGEW
jgi:regulator of RNase E activity RraA